MALLRIFAGVKIGSLRRLALFSRIAEDQQMQRPPFSLIKLTAEILDMFKTKFNRSTLRNFNVHLKNHNHAGRD
jgi:hypothetical protein